MIIDPAEQGSPEWMKCRVGIPTASDFDKIITTQGVRSKSRLKYMYQLAMERVTGVKEETYQNGTMKRGSELEPQARSTYELITDSVVVCVGCCKDDNKLYGVSPDGLIAEDGGLEIKCPSSSIHVEYLFGNKLPTEHFCQVQGQLLVTGRKWCDFMSYYPGARPLIIRVLPDVKFITALRVELEIFCKELDDTTERIR